MLTELKKDVEKAKKIMYKQNVNINKEGENLKKGKEMLELKSTKSKMKYSLWQEFKFVFEQAENRINELDDKTV